MNLFFQFLIGLWIILPAYFANGFAPLPRGKRRMDFGKTFFGNELFGAGKTWEGFFFAIFVGFIFGVVEIFIHPYLNPIAMSYGFVFPRLTLLSIFMIAFGAMLGDLVGSFIKRRIGLKRGNASPLLDQLDFVFGAFFFAAFLLDISAVSILLVIIFTPFIHIATCIIGYELGLKEVPW